MKLLTSILIFLLMSVASCRVHKTYLYFKLNDDQITRFNCLFVKDKTDVNYTMMENIYGKISTSDTLKLVNEVIYKTINLEGNKVFYALRVNDTSTLNPTIGSNYFIDCAMLFKDDSMFIASVYYKDDLNKINLKNFKTYIPPTLKISDSISYYWKKKKTTLTNFHKENLIIENKKFKNCLKIKIIEDYPETIKYSYVWLDKKLGLIRWIRATGRVDTRIF